MWQTARFKRQYTSLAVAFLLLFLPPRVFAEESKLTVAIAQGPVTLDSRLATDAASVRLLQLLAPSLMRLDASFTPQPQLAETVTHQNYQTFTVKLKESSFQDGSPVTAQTVKDFYLSILDDKLASPKKGELKDLDRIEVKSPTEIVFHLHKSSPWFLSAFEIPLLKITEEMHKFPVGAGKFTVVAHDDYGNIDLRHNNGKILSFTVVKEPMVRLLKLMRGDIDIMHNDFPEELFGYGKSKGLSGVSQPSASYTYLGFNLESTATAHVKVRQALSYAFDRETIANSLLGGRITPADSLLLPGHPAYYQAALQVYDPQKAAALLDEAGFKADENGHRFKLTLSITTNPFVLRLAQILQQDLKKIGIDLEISSSEWGTFYSNIKKGNFQTYILSWVGVFQPNIFESLFHSKNKPPQGANRGRLHHAEMDKTLDNLMQEVNDDQRNLLAQKVQQIQEEQVVYLPLWRRNHVALVRAGLHYTIPADGGYEGLTKLLTIE